jgi:uncharacterized protein (UPF0332 family)
LGSKLSDDVLTIRTHSGLIASFSLKLVKSGLIDIELGKALNKVEDLRLIADYKGDPVGMEEAAWAVQQATEFVSSMQNSFFFESCLSCVRLAVYEL